MRLMSIAMEFRPNKNDFLSIGTSANARQWNAWTLANHIILLIASFPQNAIDPSDDDNIDVI